VPTLDFRPGPLVPERLWKLPWARMELRPGVSERSGLSDLVRTWGKVYVGVAGASRSTATADDSRLRSCTRVRRASVFVVVQSGSGPAILAQNYRGAPWTNYWPGV